MRMADWEFDLDHMPKDEWFVVMLDSSFVNCRYRIVKNFGVDIRDSEGDLVSRRDIMAWASLE